MTLKKTALSEGAEFAVDLATSVPGAGPVAKIAARYAIDRLLKPRIEGEPVPYSTSMVIDGEVTYARLSRDVFNRHETEAMRAALEAAQNPDDNVLDLESQLGTLHILNVESSDWFYEHVGWTLPSHKIPDSKMVRDIPDPAMRALAEQTYYEVIIRGEPLYCFIRQKDWAYRRLLVPRKRENGRVVRIVTAIELERYNSMQRLLARVR